MQNDDECWLLCSQPSVQGFFMPGPEDESLACPPQGCDVPELLNEGAGGSHSASRGWSFWGMALWLCGPKWLAWLMLLWLTTA